MASMRNWLKDSEEDGHVVVVHCKAGKGRSGTMACSYLISEEGWTPENAMQRFTERRMRPGFGVGISIPSQQRWIRYVDRWTFRNSGTVVARYGFQQNFFTADTRAGPNMSAPAYAQSRHISVLLHNSEIDGCFVGVASRRRGITRDASQQRATSFRLCGRDRKAAVGRRVRRAILC